MDKVNDFEKKFGSENLGALLNEMAMHFPDKGNIVLCNGKLVWGLYSILYHDCLKETGVGTLDEYEIQKWVYHNIFYGYIADAVNESPSTINNLFNPDCIDFEEGYTEDDEEEEEEQPVKRGLAKYDYLLKC
jgi:hypothetical protein